MSALSAWKNYRRPHIRSYLQPSDAIAQTCPTSKLTVRLGQPPLLMISSITAWAGGCGAKVHITTVVAKNAMMWMTMEMFVIIGRSSDRKMLHTPEMSTAARTHSVLCHDVEWYDG
jgi:hypothetical protein